MYLTKFLFQAHYRIFGHFMKHQKSQRTHAKAQCYEWNITNSTSLKKINQFKFGIDFSLFLSLSFRFVALSPCRTNFPFTTAILHSTEPVHIVAIYYMRIFSYFTNIPHKFRIYKNVWFLFCWSYWTAPIPLHMEQFKHKSCSNIFLILVHHVIQ